MDWINLHASTLDSPEFIGANPVQRSTWLCLLRFCAGQENAGQIVGATTWGDRKWQQLVRVTLREVRAASDLWRWVGDDLEVNFYPVEKQKEIEAKRKAGKSTVAKRWVQQPCSADSSAISSATCSAHTEGEGKEKGTEVEGEVAVAVAPAAPKLSDEAWLQTLQNDTAFAGIDVAREFAKCARWCAENKKQNTRRRFVNWLNRCDKPISGTRTSEFGGAF